MNISKKLLLILLSVSLFLVSCDLLEEEDEKNPDYIGTWTLQTLTYSVDSYSYVADHNEYDKPEGFLEVDSSQIHFYTLDSEKDIYEHTKYDYTNNGSAFTIVDQTFYITVEGSNLYMASITNDDEDYDNDGDTLEDYTLTYLYTKYSGPEILNVVDVDTKAPSEVTNLTVTVKDGSVIFSWIDPSDEDLDSISISYSDYYEEIDAGLEEYSIDRLENGTTYDFIISTNDIYGNFSDGVSISATPSP